MRFGKKLAIIMDGNGSQVNQRPYISHRLLKDLLSTIVRAIKNPTEVSLIPGKLFEFKSTMEADICSISSQVVRERREFDVEIRSLREDSASLGILDSTNASDLVAAIQNVRKNPFFLLNLFRFSLDHVQRYSQSWEKGLKPRGFL